MKPESIPSSGRVEFARTGLLLAIFISGALFTWWKVAQTDRDMRATLLQQARFVAQAMNLESIRSLTGTGADLNRPAYLRLKEDLATTRSANPQWRFLYLLV